MLKKIAVDPAEYRDAMAHFAGHIHVVTTDGEAGKRVIAATAVTSVSDNPPIVLVCMNLKVPENDTYLRNGVFAISTLAEKHRSLAEACSGLLGASQDERFALGEWAQMSTGSPVLADAVAVFDCTIFETREMSTHRVLFGKVNDVHRGENLKPLIYHNRGYRVL